MLSQNPIFRVEEHLSHNLTDALWLSADAYYNVGGETSIDGTGQDNMANTLRVGAGLGLRIGAVQTWRNPIRRARSKCRDHVASGPAKAPGI